MIKAPILRGVVINVASEGNYKNIIITVPNVSSLHTKIVVVFKFSTCCFKCYQNNTIDMRTW